MDRELELHHADQLRSARGLLCSEDAEAFPEILFAIERTGAALAGRADALDGYRGVFAALDARLPWPADDSQNDHSGSCTTWFSADAMMRCTKVHSPGTWRPTPLNLRSLWRTPWQTARTELATTWSEGQSLHISGNRFGSCATNCSPLPSLPLMVPSTGWRVISDLALAKLLRQAAENDERGRILATSVKGALDLFGLALEVPAIVKPDETVGNVLRIRWAVFLDLWWTTTMHF